MLASADHAAQGFVIVETVFDRSEVAELAGTLETSNLDRSRAGARHLMNHPPGARPPRPALSPPLDRFLVDAQLARDRFDVLPAGQPGQHLAHARSLGATR
jgi:hypothetical protein